VTSVDEHTPLCQDRVRVSRRVPNAGAAAERPGRGPQPEAGAAPAAPARAPASRHFAKHVSALLAPGADVRQSRRHKRYAQRAVLWRESALERVRKCGRVSLGDVAITDNAGVAHYAGLTTCASIWACPVCSAKIRNSRAEEISGAAARWDLDGNSVYMVTFTAPHDLGMKLSALLPVIADSFRAVISGRAWLRVKKQAGIAGTIRSVEVTHGVNGWHPHLHVLVFVRGSPAAEGLAAMILHFREKWRQAIVKAGYRPPDDLHGVVVERCMSAAEAGAYIAKTQEGKAPGNELARSDLKSGRNGHRTPFEILEEFRWTGDAADLGLWRVYERATRGHQAITWSKGLRALLAAPERSDEDLAAEEVGGDIVVMIPVATWRAVVKVPGLSAYLLDEAERGGAEAVQSALGRYLELVPVPF
jgi:hypothetical protein